MYIFPSMTAKFSPCFSPVFVPFVFWIEYFNSSFHAQVIFFLYLCWIFPWSLLKLPSTMKNAKTPKQSGQLQNPQVGQQFSLRMYEISISWQNNEKNHSISRTDLRVPPTWKKRKTGNPVLCFDENQCNARHIDARNYTYSCHDEKPAGELFLEH